MKKYFTRFMVLLFAGVLSGYYSFSQTGIKGKVIDEYGESLVGAYIIEVSSSKGGSTDLDGNFEIQMEAGTKEIKFSFIGFDDKVVSANIEEGKMTNMGSIKLKGSVIGLGSIDIIADRARERETPVAFTNLSKANIEQQLGSRDIPLVLNVTPSVYATVGGGGAGDARINVRGFNQRNVAIMINGVPVNDMENGWVYWSNWDGVADATSSIQMQRGLSSVNLATPSIGGTMNIITSPAEHKVGGSAKFEYGSGGFMKTTLSGNSGLVNDKYAVGVSVVRKVGQGVIDKTWTDAWAYYIGGSYILNEKNRIELYAIGAPQRHGQNLYKQNLAAYSHDYAKELGADDSTLLKFPESSSGQLYNENWNTVSNYSGKQYWNGKEHDRYDSGFLAERENFYHKPVVNLNWYSQWSDKVSQFTTVYYSGGHGGGSGTAGSIKWDYAAEPTRIVDWNATIANNSVTDTAFGILRNSVNNQWTVGAISKAKISFSDNFKGQVGLDWRKAEIEHYREVRDLLGGKFFVDNSNEFESGNEFNKGLGDKILYYFTNTVNWLGYFAQAEYSNEMITAYATFGGSLISYTYVNHFTKDPNDPNKELTAETGMMSGYQLKGGLSYRPMDNMSVYGNFGLISKAPIFDNVIDDVSATVAEDPQNEDFNAFEIGADYMAMAGRLKLKGNYYYTAWNNRALNVSVNKQTPDGVVEGFIFIQGMSQLHTGFEFEGSYKPIDMIDLGFMASLGNWNYTDDVSGKYKDYDQTTNAETEVTYNYYVKDLKVGDAPQTQYALTFALLPIDGLRLQLDYRYYANHYADWDPFSRKDVTDTEQVWKTPSYMLFDLHASYRMPIADKYELEIFGHVFNLLNEMYIQDAVDNSRYNGFYGYDNRLSHTVNSAEIYLGLPTTFNVGASFRF